MNKVTSEKYNGWTNWDTWATYLWLTNEEYSYKTMRSAQGLPSFIYGGIGIIKGMGNPDNIDLDNVNWEEVEDAFKDE